MTPPTLAPDLAKLAAELARDPEYVDLRRFAHVDIDLKYATTENFMRTDVYGAFRTAFLHREAAEKLRAALAHLQKSHPEYRLRVYDALRPRTVQRRLFSFVENTPEQGYVAHPDKGSMHNYGCAIDLTVNDAQGQMLDMGTGFDEFDAASEPRREAEFLASGRLTAQQVKNRLVLREAMESAGFIQLAHEWWHYNAFAEAEVRARFKLVE